MKINSDDCFLLLIDMQEKLVPTIPNKNKIVQTSISLIDIALNLKIPIVLTEQYPKGLGETVKKIKDNLIKKKIYKIQKTTFSCLGSKCFKKTLKSLKKKQVIVAGIESHICVLQTVIDLENEGFEIFLVDNALGSRKPEYHNLGLKRMLSSSTHLTNIEMLIFELVRDSKNALFKYFSKKYIK